MHLVCKTYKRMTIDEGAEHFAGYRIDICPEWLARPGGKKHDGRPVGRCREVCTGGGGARKRPQRIVDYDISRKMGGLLPGKWSII